MMISGTTTPSTSTRVVRRAGVAAKKTDVRVNPEQINKTVVAGQQFVEIKHSALTAREAAAAYRHTAHSETS